MIKGSLNKFGYLSATISFILTFAAVGCAQEKPAEKNQHNHADHGNEVMQNGEKAMGFSQTATTHHFLLMKDGGAIRVEVNDPLDTENRDKIRTHLTGIAAQFSEGIFKTPFAVHGQMPPGMPIMDELKSEIKYKYEETENGAQVRISTENPKALAAIHDFLKFQIDEHKTGDPTSVEKVEN